MSKIPPTLIGKVPMSTKMIYIFWSCRNPEEAKRIIHGLLNERLIACASIYPQVESIYRWEGKVEEDIEAKVILKTTANHFDGIRDYIAAHCSYEVPEIVQVEISEGNPAYIAWLTQETSPLQ